VDAAQALADLTAISTQIELAVLVDSRGEVLATAGTTPETGETIAHAGRRLLTAAEGAMGEGAAREPLVQLQVAMSDGSVFLVQDGERVIVALTSAEPTVGLIFYDLKTCLRHVAGESLTPKPKAKAGSRKAEDGGNG
jgi:predicted regulator of Ras-like GTPase activity (Roadblock/LC7/MglB family)